MGTTLADFLPYLSSCGPTAGMAEKEVEKTTGFSLLGSQWQGWGEGARPALVECFLFLSLGLLASLPLWLTQSGHGLRAPNHKAGFFPLSASETQPGLEAPHAEGTVCLMALAGGRTRCPSPPETGRRLCVCACVQVWVHVPACAWKGKKTALVVIPPVNLPYFYLR